MNGLGVEINNKNKEVNNTKNTIEKINNTNNTIEEINNIKNTIEEIDNTDINTIEEIDNTNNNTIEGTYKEGTYKKRCVLVNDQVCIQADVKIDPKVSIGEIKAFCEEPIIGKCCRIPCSHESCKFAVSQTMCVEIPLTFTAEIEVDPAGHVCGIPRFGPCCKCK